MAAKALSSHGRTVKRWALVLSVTFGVLSSAMVYLIWRDGQSHDALVPSSEASSILIQRTDFDDVQLSKNDGQWRIEAPCSLAANEQRLEPLLGALTPGAHQYQSGEVDLEAAGLDTPLAIVHINGIEHKLGNTDLSGDRRYVQRGDVVEFVPEWVLSLVNGGVTALATLEIFAKPLVSIKLIKGNGMNLMVDSAGEPEVWQDITAQQIVTWPQPDNDPEVSYTLQTTATDGMQQSFAVFKTDAFVALQLEGAACAYILPADALPE